MSHSDNYLQTEFYDLLKNDESILQWLSENIIDGIWYCDLEQPGNLWISGSFWKNLDYSVEEEESAFKSSEMTGTSQFIYLRNVPQILKNLLMQFLNLETRRRNSFY